GKNGTLTFELSPHPSQRPAPGTYEAILIAGGESGGTARRSAKIVVSGAAADAAAGPGSAAGAQAGGGADSAQPLDLTLVGVNLLPSLLSSLGYVLLVAALGIVLLRRRLPRWAFAAGACALAALVLLVADGLWDQPSVHAISSRPVAIPGASEGQSGLVA